MAQCLYMNPLDIVLLTAVAVVVISSVGTIASTVEDNYKRNARAIAQRPKEKIEVTMQPFPARQRQVILETLPVGVGNVVAELGSGAGGQQAALPQGGDGR